MKNLDPIIIKEVENEVSVMTLVNHPNVLKIVKYGEGQYVSRGGGKKYNAFYIALELCQVDTLFDYILAMDGLPISEPVAAHLTY